MFINPEKKKSWILLISSVKIKNVKFRSVKIIEKETGANNSGKAIHMTISYSKWNSLNNLDEYEQNKF